MLIDKETGQTPLSAAERMDLHDRSMGVEPLRPAKPSAAPDLSAAARAESGLSARAAPAQQSVANPAPAGNDGKARIAAAIAGRNKRPWTPPQPTDRAALQSTPQPDRNTSRPAPGADGRRKTIVTSKWWDTKGPRTIELGPRGQQTLSGGFMTLAFVALIVAVVALFIAPVLLLAGAFLLFRFGGKILGPIGAGVVDKAIAERN